ncbi:uracil-DNA glycosylase family protein [Leptospira meyeri]|uniref:uracil-DNA glycosylase family protein n=1 Tax=Leptospira meyeri TaxID=29508 RepID=UPI0013FDC5A3|nr:uracil-DNA glycosylase family protein [Leptospira meyeri]
MDGSQRVLNRSAGNIDADIMFVGEAPGRLGADNTGIPFHGDKAGHNFEELLDFAKIERAKIFVTNAILCNPKDDFGNNAPPAKVEISNCSNYLEEQIKVVNPKIIVTLGSVALESTRCIFRHSLNLKENVRTENSWFDRILIPLYHPGQRAMLHRSFANQRSDYQFVAEIMQRLYYRKKNNYQNAKVNYSILSVLKSIFANVNDLDYFKLHKLFYLIEYEFFKEHKERLTTAYIVRQKDGPYCTDLHIQKLKKWLPDMEIRNTKTNLMLSYHENLFANSNDTISEDAKKIILNAIKKYGKLSNAEIKTKVYLTQPMKEFLRAEKANKINLYNAPISFEKE